MSATKPRENEKTTIRGTPWSVGSITGCPWSVFDLKFCSFFALRSWQLMNDHGGRQNTASKGKTLGQKTKNPAKYIKQL